MKTAEEMTVVLQGVLARLEAGDMKHKDAAEAINSVGKMIGLAKVQLEYHKMRRETPAMRFFGGGAAGADRG